jgi:beta-N-acetylhexosaminidase
MTLKEIVLPTRLLLLATVAGSVWLYGCSGSGTPVDSPAPVDEAAPQPAETLSEDSLQAASAPPEVAPDTTPPVEPPEDLPQDWASRTLRSMTLRQKVGQMMMPFVLGDYAPEGSPSHERVLTMITDNEIGGLIVSVGSPGEVALKLNDFQRHSRHPLLVSADLETGAGYRMRGAVFMPAGTELGGATDFPSLMALGAVGDPSLAYQMGRITATEARAVGIHVPFAPVLDVNNNPDNPIINVRSLGEEPDQVARLGAALVRGIQDYGGIATGKHFPGHGDTETDSHLDLPVIRVSRARMDSVEFVPFRAAIEAGLGGMMTAHVAVPELNGGSERDPATLSTEVLTDILRGEMGFDGLLFTDAMDMFAIDRRFSRAEAAVRAVEAGADVLLMVPDVGAAVEGLVEAIEGGRIPVERIDASVLRLLRVKESLGLHESREVDPGGVPRTVGIPEHEAVAREIAEGSITLLKNDRDILPLLGTRNARVLSVTYGSRTNFLQGRYFNRRLRQTYARLRTAGLHRDSPESDYEEIMTRAAGSQLVVVSTYVTVVSYSGTVALPEELSDFIRELAARRIPHVVVSFGNPYLIREFPEAQAYMLAWSDAAVSQRAAADALFGDREIKGRMPTAVPPLFEIGDGIQLPPKGEER